MRMFLLGLGAALLATTVAAQEPIPITRPVWEGAPPRSGLPPRFTFRDYRDFVGVRCVVVAGALTNCVADEETPAPFAEAAIGAASAARLAANDADGAPTDGRTIQVRIGFPIPMAVDPPPAPPATDFISNMRWLETPSAPDFHRYYPAAALQAGLDARVVLECIVGENGRLACTIISEEPIGHGFDIATLQVAPLFRAAPENRDGVATAGRRLRLPIRWVSGRN
jgi:TonB family protein